MGKIFLLIYVIIAVISIIAKQKKKKRLQQQIQGNQGDSGNSRNELKEDVVSLTPHQPEFVNPLKKHLDSWTKKNALFSRQQIQQKPAKTEENKITKGKNILMDVAKEFGINLEDEDDEKDFDKSLTEPAQGRGQLVDVILKNSTDESDEFNETQSIVSPYESPKKVMGLASRKPQVSPSLAFTLNSSKDRLISDLKYSASVKRAFILKTILDRPVAFKNPFTR